MNDQFLYDVRPDMPEGLEEAILDRITRLRANRIRSLAGGETLTEVLTWRLRHKVLVIVLALLFLVACVSGILRIGGFFFAQKAENPVVVPEGVEPVTQELVSREEALKGLSFDVALPTWMPVGYVLSDQAMVTLPYEAAPLSEAWQLWLYWKSGASKEILLLAFPSKYYRGDELSFGPGSVQKVSINGIPAAAVRGNWLNGAWDESAGGNVLWTQDGITYWLQSVWVSLEDLEHIAESVR